MEKLEINKNFLMNTLLYTIILLLLTVVSKRQNYTVVFQVSILIWISILVVIIHELGHFFIGKVLGLQMQFLSLVIIFFVKRKVYLNHPISLATGFSLMFSNNLDISIKKLVLYCLGGPGANLLTTIVTYFFLKGWYLSKYFLIMNIIIFLATIVPFINGTDGKNVYNLITEKKKSEFYKSFINNSIYYNECPNMLSKEVLLKNFKELPEFNQSIIDIEQYFLENNNLEVDFFNRKYENIEQETTIQFYLMFTNKNNEQYNEELLKKINKYDYGDTMFYIKGYLEDKENNGIFLEKSKEHLDEVSDPHQRNILYHIISTCLS
ncbi:hypothetical protein SAMN02745245_00386 [Anaerosphaera aminiphila DSM 21120]|uniref:Peptidase M50 domain-containing protein n=1 Tax=Anaerosphaera aminiphila DSM 21120 TaxID=1120995 RepID=A0A1M5PM80_9FIRM|nr:site-2 protease family protein [Anaerosphaera aminiphila]SHH02817.1 hypothetical protein SAMN02745245_00386 [Anaerosphaera aminiphila DSM 21120]